MAKSPYEQSVQNVLAILASVVSAIIGVTQSVIK